MNKLLFVGEDLTSFEPVLSFRSFDEFHILREETLGGHVQLHIYPAKEREHVQLL
jgi:hypothetical protein